MNVCGTNVPTLGDLTPTPGFATFPNIPAHPFLSWLLLPQLHNEDVGLAWSLMALSILICSETLHEIVELFGSSGECLQCLSHTYALLTRPTYSSGNAGVCAFTGITSKLLLFIPIKL